MSCSHNSFFPKATNSSRLPASQKEFQDYEYGDRSEIRLTSSMLAKVDFANYSFKEFIATAQKYQYKKIVIEPENNSAFKKVSGMDDTYPSGDFIVLIGTNFTANDELIRKADYDDIFENVKRMSWLKFRTTINLVASVSDLKTALKNTRPTIIVWTSHGNESFFYDFNQIRVPYDVFKDTSPSVYQLILTSCNGFTAIQNGYKKYIPGTLKYWAWERLVYHPSDLQARLSSQDWNPYIGYPGPVTYNGMSCVKRGNKGFDVIKVASGAIVPESGRTTYESCMYPLMNSDSNYICTQQADKSWAIYNHRINAVMPGVNFDANYDCNSRITNGIQAKVCRRIGENYFYVDSKNKVSQESFKTLDACSEYIQASDDV
jgi:hypothetical protein